MEYEIEITGLGVGGEGVGSLDGLKVFVPDVLPGERACISLTVRKKRYAKGRLLKLLRRSPQRTTPSCPVFEQCGGCQLMHLSAEGQLLAKRQRVLDALERIGSLKDIEVNACLPSPTALGYRNKIQLPLVTSPDGVQMGLYARGSHDLISIEHCLIHCPLGERVVSKVMDLLDCQTEWRHLIVRTAVNSGEVLVILVTKNQRIGELGQQLLAADPAICGVVQNINTTVGNTILGKQWRLLAGRDYLEEELAGLRLRLSPASFFQVNTPQAANLYRYAIEQAALSKDDRVADLYCGVGALSLLAAQYTGAVVGIEVAPQAIQNAKLNAQLNNITNCRFICGPCEGQLTHLERIDVAFINPPRKGCAPEVLDALVQSEVKCLVYISCDPATLARDLAWLTSKGYQVETTQPFDLFPQTAHIETVVRLARA